MMNTLTTLLTGFILGLCAFFVAIFGYGLWFSWMVTEGENSWPT